MSVEKIRKNDLCDNQFQIRMSTDKEIDLFHNDESGNKVIYRVVSLIQKSVVLSEDANFSSLTSLQRKCMCNKQHKKTKRNILANAKFIEEPSR